MFCTKAPSILTISTPSLRRLRNEVWPAPKSSMAMRQPRSLTRVTKPRASSTFWMAAVSVISMISRSAARRLARSSAPRPIHQLGSTVEAGETLTLACRPGAAASSFTTSSSTRWSSMRTRPSRSATGMISLALSDAAVGAAHPHQAFVEGDLAALAPSTTGSKASAMRRSLSAAHDLVGRARAVAPQRVALDVRPVGHERAVRAWRARRAARPGRGRGFPCTERAWRGAVTPPIVTVTATGPAAVGEWSRRARRRAAARRRPPARRACSG